MSTTHVNVALPFGKVEVNEPGEQVRALANILQDMAALVARTAPGPEADELLRRAEQLAGTFD